MIDRLTGMLESFDEIIILGYGREGKSSYRMWRKYFPQVRIVIADSNAALETEIMALNDPMTRFVTGASYQEVLRQKALIMRSPGIKADHTIVNPESRMSSQTDLFLQAYHDQVIGVSGTKGKSTTASLIAHLLGSAGREVVLIGNIGVPAFDCLNQLNSRTMVVYELSAHQLQEITHSPHVSVLLNIYPEHLDYFKGLEAYENAKMNLLRYQMAGDIAVLTPQSGAKALELAPSAILCSVDQPADIMVTEDGLIKIRAEQYSVPEMQLAGKHNLQNLLVALAVVDALDVPVSSALEAVPAFKGLPHRLQLLGTYKGVEWVNDSISTIPASAMAAVKALGNVGTLILGGYDRGLDYSELVSFAEGAGLHSVVLMGDAGKRMAACFSVDTPLIRHHAADLEEAVQWAATHTPKGSICLLSPAAASYDRFRNFEHRGDHFMQLVATL